MKRVISALVAGVVLGSTGIAVAGSFTETWTRNGIICMPVPNGVGCTVDNNRNAKKKVYAIVRTDYTGVGTDGGILFRTKSR